MPFAGQTPSALSVHHREDCQRHQRAGARRLDYHQDLGGKLIVPRSVSENDSSTSAEIRARSRLSGLLNYYHREAVQ